VRQDSHRGVLGHVNGVRWQQQFPIFLITPSEGPRPYFLPLSQARLSVSYGERLCDPHLCPSFVAMDLDGPDLKSAEYDQRSGEFEHICLTEPFRVDAKCQKESLCNFIGSGRYNRVS